MKLDDPGLFINRELSWLAFNERVLEEAEDQSLPLFERLKFIAIVSSNFDEFFMVRVAGLKQQILSGVADLPADGMLPAEQLQAISRRVHAMVDRQYRLWREELLPLLEESGLHLIQNEAANPEQLKAARKHFVSILPALTPLAVDPGHPFPHLRNKSLNLAVILGRTHRRRKRPSEEDCFAVVQVPSVLPRLVPVPFNAGRGFMLLEDIIAANVADLFPGFTVRQTAAFRVTRNWDLNVDEEESEDLLSTIQEELRRRDRGAAVRLQIDAAATKELEEDLTALLFLGAEDVYRVDGPLQLGDMLPLTDADPRPELRAEPLAPAVPEILRGDEPITAVVAQRDVLLHHPYDSFEPVVRFIEEAAEDPQVLCIKQTLYRTSGDSPFVRALTRAAENGKQVAVLVEIKARFDEANNIAWAHRLEENGVHVVYGIIGLKTHCKVALVVRREGDHIRRYVHLGTGNYNPQTARQYTDLSLFTAKEEIADDVTALFNLLTGFSDAPRWKRLAVAPFDLRERIVRLINDEAARARNGEPARIIAKMNALVDPITIQALYEASQAGVSIDLIVRGICCLRPGVPGVSENIRVVSIVDRFLEHSRVFAFGTPDRAQVFVSSADWMPRNFQRRIEVMFPVEDPLLRGRLLDEILGLPLEDNVKARQLLPDGTYVRVGRDGPQIRSQTMLIGASRRGHLRAVEPILRHAPAAEIERPAIAIKPKAG